MGKSCPPPSPFPPLPSPLNGSFPSSSFFPPNRPASTATALPPSSLFSPPVFFWERTKSNSKNLATAQGRGRRTSLADPPSSSTFLSPSSAHILASFGERPKSVGRRFRPEPFRDALSLFSRGSEAGRERVRESFLAEGRRKGSEEKQLVSGVDCAMAAAAVAAISD